MKWFHYIFDPTRDDLTLAGQSALSRYCKRLPFKTTLAKQRDEFYNALVEFENIFPYSSEITVSSGSTSQSLLGVGPSLYFCIPSNEKLLEHWDTVADRLFKIRHCMDIDAMERHLALFSPPIDP